MFSDDRALVKELASKYGTPLPIVEAGGLERPTIADYQITIDAMALIANSAHTSPAALYDGNPDVIAAQHARYLDIPRPLSFLGPYEIENPETGGLPLERLIEKYDPARGTGIGTAILLSVLEHVNDPFEAIDRLRDSMKPGGLVIVSVPFIFPEHAECGQDCWRFTPTALKHIFSPPSGSEEPPRWHLLAADWRLRIPASAGVFNIKNGEPQAIESCYAIAQAI